MTKKHRLLGHAILAVAVWLVAAPVAAQAPPPPQSPGGIAPPARIERPYRGLFGSGVGNTEQSLTVDSTLGGGFVEDPLTEQGGTPPTGDPGSRGGPSLNGSAITTYSLNRGRFGVSVNYEGVLDFYPELQDHRVVPRHFVTGYFMYRPSESTSVAFVETFKNLPEFSYADLFDPELGPGLPVARAPRLSLDRYTRFGSGIEASHRLSKRTSLSGDFNWAHGLVADREWTILKGSATLSHNITKGMALYVGYQEGGQQDKSGGISRPRERQPKIDFGVNFNRPLSLSRRTMLTFSTGLEGVRNRELAETKYYVVGSANLSREFGQTWLAGFSYSRDVRQVESISESVIGNFVTFGVAGSFSQRLQLQSRVGTSSGRLGAGATGSRYDSKFGSVNLSYALNRTYALGADYVYSRYSARSGAPPLESFSELNSGSIRAYLQMYLPLYTRTKRD